MVKFKSHEYPMVYTLLNKLNFLIISSILLLCYFLKKILGKEKNLTFLLIFEKKFWVRKKIFLKCAEQIKYGSNVYATF